MIAVITGEIHMLAVIAGEFCMIAVITGEIHMLAVIPGEFCMLVAITGELRMLAVINGKLRKLALLSLRIRSDSHYACVLKHLLLIWPIVCVQTLSDSISQNLTWIKETNDDV